MASTKRGQDQSAAPAAMAREPDAPMDLVADVGSTFWFTARLKKGAPAPTSSGNVLESHETALVHRTVGGRTLLVEDEPINREVTLELLSDIPTKIDVAEDGAEAVAMATARDYDLILMDMQMPNMDGLDATRPIRQTANGAQVPILAIISSIHDVVQIVRDKMTTC